tara:strand:+ start:1543 stop:2271 length:729 start_codon:yes stop_codon:yes gene_type:complete
MQHWGWGEIMAQGSTSFTPILTFLRDEETRGALVFFGIVMILVTSKIYYSIAVKDSELHDEVLYADEWSITFLEESTTYSETLLLSDGDDVDIEFGIDSSVFSAEHRIGYVQVTISYSETNQVVGGDPCDSVQGGMVQSDYPAQWTAENNTLTGGSSSCQDISLFLLTYPNYDGQSYTRTAHNQVIALDEWVDEGYGIGSFDVNIKLEVQQSQIPTQNNDDDETVQIDVTFVAFEANAEKLS